MWYEINYIKIPLQVSLFSKLWKNKNIQYMCLIVDEKCAPSPGGTRIPDNCRGFGAAGSPGHRVPWTSAGGDEVSPAAGAACLIVLESHPAAQAGRSAALPFRCRRRQPLCHSQWVRELQPSDRQVDAGRANALQTQQEWCDCPWTAALCGWRVRSLILEFQVHFLFCQENLIFYSVIFF